VSFFRDVYGPLARRIPLGVTFVRLVDGVDISDPVRAAEGRVVFELHRFAELGGAAASARGRPVVSWRRSDSADGSACQLADRRVTHRRRRAFPGDRRRGATVSGRRVDMSPRSIWTACLIALTVYTPDGRRRLAARRPGERAHRVRSRPPPPAGSTRPIGPGRSAGEPTPIAAAGRARPGPLRDVGVGAPGPSARTDERRGGILIWPAAALILIAFAVLLIRVPGSRRPLAALALVAVALVGAGFIALLGVMSSWTDPGTNIRRCSSERPSPGR
jgi:hypothetical protein